MATATVRFLLNYQTRRIDRPGAAAPGRGPLLGFIPAEGHFSFYLSPLITRSISILSSRFLISCRLSCFFFPFASAKFIFSFVPLLKIERGISVSPSF